MRFDFFLIAATMMCLEFSPAMAATWATPVEAELSSEASQVALDMHGNIVELLKVPYGLNHVAFARTYKNSTNSWSDPVQLSPLDADAHALRLIVDPSGNAAAVWQITDEHREKIQAAVYRASTDQWSPTTDLSEMARNLILTHAAMAESGDVFVAWKKTTDHHDLFKTITFSQSSGKWSSPTIQILPKGEAQQPSLFLDPVKNALLKMKLTKQL